MWCVYLVILVIFINSVEPTNQPVYKIALTQKGFPQFLQYAIDTPPIREFTLCVWVRIFKFSDEQTVFTYMVHSKYQIMRLWIEEDGKAIKLSIKGVTLSSIPVDMTRDRWHHICLSYQSDYGAWALYFNGRLASCEASQSIFRYKLPAGGHVIFGHGSLKNGFPNGLEGEIYGINVLLVSTIEKDYTLNQYYYNDKEDNSETKSTQNTDVHQFEQQITPQTMKNSETSNEVSKRSRNFIKFNTPYGHFEYDIGVDLTPKMKLKSHNEIANLTLPQNRKNSELNASGMDKFINNKQFEQFGSHTKELPAISEYETPPPSPSKIVQDNLFPTSNVKVNPGYFLLGTSGPNIDSMRHLGRENSPQANIPDIEIPPPIEANIPDIEIPPPIEKKNEVYGQWTTSSFAKDVLNYLKSINGVSSSQRKIPETIPLSKISDHFPYSSNLMPTKILAPEVIRQKYFQHHIKKRENRLPQINVEILENDIRSWILEEHANTYPKNVEITNRGTNRIDKAHRFYKNVSSTDMSASSSLARFKEVEMQQQKFYNNFVNIVPYLKSGENFSAVDYANKNDKLQNNISYTNNLPSGSKWHNIRYHSNFFSPKDLKNNNYSTELMDQQARKSLYNHAMDKGFLYITDISRQSNPFEVASLLRNENGLYADQTAKAVNTLAFVNKSENSKSKFNQHVKIGNALNERDIIGNIEKKGKQSFIGGNENIPDIQRYRSDIDFTKDHVPPSLSPKVCKEVEQLDRLFNFNSDNYSNMEKGKNFALEFIKSIHNCDESILETHYSLLITWSETPVRLFGGAYPKKAVNQCGFF